jgi:hypothetical protein
METARRRLWLAVSIPPAAWAVQGLLGWFIASHACPGTSKPWSLGAARIAIIVVTVLALATSIPALISSARRYRAQEQQPERVHYLSMVGLVVGAALTLGLLLAGLPAIVVHACGEMR